MSIFRSTRGRLVVTAVAIFAIALVVADSVVLAAVSAFQWQETDAVLVAQAQLLVASAQDSNGQLSFDPSDLPGETPSGIAVDAALIAGNAVISQTRNQPLTSDSLVSLARQAIAAGHPVSVDLVDSRHVPRRAYAMPVGGGGGEVLIVSRSVVELLEFQGRTMASLLAVSIVLLIMGGALTYWLAGRALRPVRNIAGIARSISEHDLHRRVDVKVPPDELGELVDTFNSMLARLEAGFESMGRFTADASHELRAPLTLMRAEIESAMRRGRSKEEYRRALESVQGEVDHLTRLTDQLLMLARADAGALKPAKEAVDVADFLHETGARWEPVAERRKIRVEVSAPASGYVDGDPALLRRVMDNLVDNAIRYTGEGTSVALRGYASNGGWNVDVVDHGPGIPPRYRSKLFSRFARPDMARSAEDGGAGLGLALSAAIARAHGGSLELVENGEPGAVFRLHLPRRKAA
jgi:two-component system OmpR family sensor kinase